MCESVHVPKCKRQAVLCARSWELTRIFLCRLVCASACDFRHWVAYFLVLARSYCLSTMRVAGLFYKRQFLFFYKKKIHWRVHMIVCCCSIFFSNSLRSTESSENKLNSKDKEAPAPDGKLVYSERNFASLLWKGIAREPIYTKLRRGGGGGGGIMHTSLSLYSLLQNLCLFITKDQKTIFFSCVASLQWLAPVHASFVCRWFRLTEGTTRRHLAELPWSRPLASQGLPNWCSSACDFAVNEMKWNMNNTNEKGALQHTATNRMHACLFASAFSSFLSWIFMVVIPCLLCCFVLASTSTPAHNNEGTGTVHHDSPPADNTRRQRSKVVDGWKQVSALRTKKWLHKSAKDPQFLTRMTRFKFFNLTKTRRSCNKYRYA